MVALLAALVLLGDNWLSLRIPWQVFQHKNRSVTECNRMRLSASAVRPQDFGTGMHAISKMLPGDALDLRRMLILWVSV